MALLHWRNASRSWEDLFGGLQQNILNGGVVDIYWVVVSNIFCFHPYLGKWSKLTNVFRMGWNHQLVYLYTYIHTTRTWYIQKNYGLFLQHIYTYVMHEGWWKIGSYFDKLFKCIVITNWNDNIRPGVSPKTPPLESIWRGSINTKPKRFQLLFVLVSFVGVSLNGGFPSFHTPSADHF